MVSYCRRRIKVSLGEKIRKIRLEKNLKQIEVAKRADISNSYLSDIEVERTQPSLKTLRKIASVLETDCSELLREID